MGNEEELWTTIDYQFDGEFDGVVWLEEICNSLGIEVEKYWMRELDEETWLGDSIVTVKTKPEIAELYNLTYSLLVPNYQTNNKAKFAEWLIDNMLEYIGYIEACLLKDIDNKKEDV